MAYVLYMPDLTFAGIPTKNPGLYDYTLVGTAAGTTTVQAFPTVLHAIHIQPRVASGAITLYDSVGTSLNVIGTITLGTQTFGDVSNPYVFDIRTKNGLTVVNSANVGALVTYGL